jgi:FkbM family methyltransferase|tara:strand:+ start:1456 stop:2073 length:618 start_codon:yes stop_codon:yes gene_type:complete
MNKYFIDCGAHCGESILAAKQRFGDDIITISFEPIPGLAKQLQEIHKDNPTVNIQNSAVWINNEVKKFHLSEEYTDGSSLLDSLNNLREEHSIKIPCFDLSTWISETFDENDYLILKLDIEGAEYEVLNKMIKDNTIGMINEFWGEWHDMKISDQETLKISKKVYKYLEDNNIEFKEWEIHIPTYGKSHPQLAFRPSNLTDLDNE